MSKPIKSDLRRAEVAERTRQQSKTALTKSAILATASRFLEAHPFRDLTVGALMAEAGYSRPTFYQYFNDLHGLMETLLDDVKTGIIDGAQPWLAGQGDPIESLQRSLTALVDVGHEQGPILKAVADAAPSDSRLEHVWETFLAAFDEVVAARITEDQARGVTPQFDPYPVAQALNRMDAGLIITAFGQADKADKAAACAALRRIWISTLYPTVSNTPPLSTADSDTDRR